LIQVNNKLKLNEATISGIKDILNKNLHTAQNLTNSSENKLQNSILGKHFFLVKEKAEMLFMQPNLGGRLMQLISALQLKLKL